MSLCSDALWWGHAALSAAVLRGLLLLLVGRGVAVLLAARRVARRQGQGAAGHSHRGLGQILGHGPAVSGRVVLLDGGLVALLRLVPASQQVQLVGQRGQAGGAHPEHERGGPAPRSTLRREDLHGDHIHPLSTGPQLAASPPRTPSLPGWPSSASHAESPGRPSRSRCRSPCCSRPQSGSRRSWRSHRSPGCPRTAGWHWSGSSGAPPWVHASARCWRRAGSSRWWPADPPRCGLRWQRGGRRWQPGRSVYGADACWPGGARCWSEGRIWRRQREESSLEQCEDNTSTGAPDTRGV